jgi:pimeloyl-ACP methyl ester carboxylesterase
MKYFLIFLLGLFSWHSVTARVDYPYPLKKLTVRVEGGKYQMAYMDVIPASSYTGKAILILHGKNFNGYYWKGVIGDLTGKGYRVIMPDQLGWGRSDKPNLHYSFHMLAANTKALLDSLGIKKIFVLGHSMGGMLAIRFSLLYPDVTEKLILEDPIGLEDYKLFVPYRSLDQLYEKEKSATYDSYKKYQQSYYPAWKPEYEQYVAAQAAVLDDAGFKQAAFVNAVTYQVIYEQPVIYELEQVHVPVLLIVGAEDRTIVGKNLLTDDQKKVHGQYPVLAMKAVDRIKDARLVILDGVGHIPHIQAKEAFLKSLFAFLQ